MFYCYGNGYVYVFIRIQHYDSCEIYGDINVCEEDVMILFIDEWGILRIIKRVVRMDIRGNSVRIQVDIPVGVFHQDPINNSL